jgi:hypothetical protein
VTNTYVLDADVFIRAKNHHYDMTFCPGFWDWLIDRRKANRVFSIKAIFDDLCQTATDDDEEDELSKWVKSDGSSLFLPHDQEMTDKLPVVSIWASSQNYTAAAINEFLGCSDYFIVSYALAHNHTIVTHEVPSISNKKIKIPDACRCLKIKCVTPFEMIRSEGARFVLDNSTPPA